ncbi:MAG: AAA family ATPase [Mycobacterium sp.]|uniref:helix-turn-helix transcriptional regulator n=1 Tax=Mycobacterium sp. TaxID=1785 RepID=UPI003CC528A1
MAERRHLSAGQFTRRDEAETVADFLVSACREPAALVVEGEPGIGKTTLWLAAVEQARERGFWVLSARAAAVESGLAYAALADLLCAVDAAVLDQLPERQQVAVDRILLRTSERGAATDQRAVSAAFLSIIERLGETSPVLLAIDDLQWLDHSSRHVLAFATRRLAAGVGVLCTRRTGTPGEDASSSWLNLPKPDAIGRIRLGPLSLGALHAVVCERLEKSFPRPTMVRIHEVSGGNPFYAVEIARVIDTQAPVGEVSLPRTLFEVVQSRLDSLEVSVRNALLAMACLSSATTGEVIRATDMDSDSLIELLEQAEGEGIIEITGNRLEFTHPLLARGVYDSAAPAQRRRMHRRLGQIVGQPEQRARHLALGATRGDLMILQALDRAAESANTRGAPHAAAELLELAMRLGGDTPQRRIVTAANHFDAGDPGRARSLLEETTAQMPAGPARAAALHLLALVRLYGDNFGDAAELLKKGLDEAAENAALRVQMLVALAFALVNTGNLPAALSTVEDGVTAAGELGAPPLMSLALGMRVVLHVMRGDGFDEASMRQAITHEDRYAKMPLAFRPTVQSAMLLGWMGQLERAHEQMLAIRRDCIERGEEGELMFVDFHMVTQAIWRGDFTEAALVADDTMERAVQLGGDFPAFIGLTVRATVAAYSGHDTAARRDIDEALAAGQRSNAHTLMQWTVDVLGFLEVSLGNYEAALTTLQARLNMLEAVPDSTEIISASFVPDAVEALIQVGRIGEAESLASTLQRNGERLDRAWMLAIAARCRSMLLAADGDLDEAILFAQRAMAQHDRLAMPFELARTQLLLGQLQRRSRRRDAAAATLREALATFERLDTPLWAARARASLARSGPAPTRASLLTASERRVAELAASGMTNRDVAGALFISVKTVEVNLTRIYRKLDIHSRAELGRRIDQLGE